MYTLAVILVVLALGYYFKPEETKALLTSVWTWGAAVAAGAVQYLGYFDFTSLFK